MDKNHFGKEKHAFNLNIKGKANEDVLEISSTGFGLESVSTEKEEADTKFKNRS